MHEFVAASAAERPARHHRRLQRAILVVVILGCCAAAPRERVLYSFPSGTGPFGALVADSAGALYATTLGDGMGYGTVVRLTPRPGRRDWVARVLVDFTGADGGGAYAGLTAGSAGTLYGTTRGGGRFESGVVYRLTPPSRHQYFWNETVLHAFTDANGDGYGPFAGSLVVGQSGAIYGTTASGGVPLYPNGIAFRLVPPTRGMRWDEQIIHTFREPNDGLDPFAGFVLGPAGVLYGATVADGFASGCGTLYSLTKSPSQKTWTESILYAFGGTAKGDGCAPYATPVQGSDGTLYGTTEGGGTAGLGSVYALAPTSSGSSLWTEYVLHSFTGGTDGQQPWAPVTLGADGAVYGVAAGGGPQNDGIVFRLSRPRNGGAWKEGILHAFSGADGVRPFGPLLQGPRRVLYGTTEEGGAFGGGTIFEVTM